MHQLYFLQTSKTKMFTMMQPSMGARPFRDLIDTTPAVLLGIR